LNINRAFREQFLIAVPESFYRNLRRLNGAKSGVVEKTRVSAKLPVFLKSDQVEALLSYARTRRDLLILRLLYYCALRVSEVLGLRLEDIDFEGRVIKVCHAVTSSGMPKEYKERLVPVDEKTLVLIKEYVGDRVQGRIFNLSIRRVQSMIKQRARRAGIPNWRQITPHKLRHSFATHYYQQTKDLLGLQKMLGHSSVAATEIYAHLDMDQVKDLYDHVVSSITDQQSKPVTLNDIYKLLLRIDKRLTGGNSHL